MHHHFIYGVDTHYTLKGNGRDVVLLHGFTESAAVFDNISLSGCRVIAVDLPGHGHSTGGEQFAEMAAYGKWLHALVELLALENPIIIGHSMGGYVALSYARQYDNIGGLGLWHSTAYADNDEKRHNRDRGIAFVNEYGVGRYTGGLIPLLFPTEDNQHVSEVLAIARQTTKDGIVQTLAAMRDRPDSTAVLRKVACPVLFLHGLKDRVIPYEDIAGQIDLAAHTMYIGIKHIAHMGMYEDPAACSKALNAFISNC